MKVDLKVDCGCHQTIRLESIQRNVTDSPVLRFDIYGGWAMGRRCWCLPRMSCGRRPWTWLVQERAESWYAERHSGMMRLTSRMNLMTGETDSRAPASHAAWA